MTGNWKREGEPEAEKTEAGVEVDGRVGPFPNWKSLYVTVVIYGFLVIGALLVLTRALSF